ncbi:MULTISPECIES: glycosyltransferase [unclassified Pseudoclavibacter]|uniref:glycosyltransferase n=1 Tax=unclassified Pseudoclavibacter TaxID=2615177 RepID=UPI001BA56638|nr:glycosyltransferase [Pseudoclavibacter sp. Marseille-Q4354]MBS3180152.1 glycosyltransferase [Pseudoclavibacter sp. Marseille-Q4354]
MERSIADHADTVIVFSDKDRSLLVGYAPVVVVRPPLAAGSEILQKRDVHPPYVLFVGPLHRAENADAMTYFTSHIWPTVRASIPDARLLIAGRKPSDEASPLFSKPGVELLGFVDDIDQLYSGARAVVAPLRLGAGLKFKVLDALVREVPLIGTQVALEGVESGSQSLEAFDSSTRFAAAVIEAFTTTAPPQTSTIDTNFVRQRYGLEQFSTQIRAIYGIESSSGETEPSPPEVSVVIPVRNGERQLPDQLEALACQREAPTFEVLIADNGSTDRTRSVALAYGHRFRDLRIVDAGQKPGVNYARNTGVQHARGDKVLICDHDDVVSARWVAALSTALDESDVVGGLSVPIWLDRNGGRVEDRSAAASLRDCLGYLPYALGANMGVRRATFLEAGGFDESFWGGHDEVEFSWRLQRMGATLTAVDDAELSYLQRSTVRGTYKQAYNSSRTRIQLWARYNAKADLSPVSYRGALDEMIRAVQASPQFLKPSTRLQAARSLGSAFGTASGHLKYRLLGAPPAAELASDHPPAEDNA